MGDYYIRMHEKSRRWKQMTIMFGQEGSESYKGKSMAFLKELLEYSFKKYSKYS